MHLCLLRRIQDGHQKGRESDFWKNAPVDYADTLWVQNFATIALCYTVSKINAFLHFMHKFKMAAEMAGKQFLRKRASRFRRYPVGQKFCTVIEINALLLFTQNSRWPPKLAGKRFLGKLASTLCRYPAVQKFLRNRSISAAK